MNKIKEKIYDYVKKDINFLVKNIPILFLFIIFTEAIKKFSLHISWVPFFVLDSEPLVTTFWYGIVFMWIWIWFFIYSSLILSIEHFKILKDNYRLVIGLWRWLALLLFMQFIFYISYTKLSDENKNSIIYVSKDFKVELWEKYNKIYFINEDKPFLFCKKTILSDDCIDKIK